MTYPIEKLLEYAKADCRRLQSNLESFRESNDDLADSLCKRIRERDEARQQLAALRPAMAVVRVVEYEMSSLLERPSDVDDEARVWACIVDWQERLKESLAESSPEVNNASDEKLGRNCPFPHWTLNK